MKLLVLPIPYKLRSHLACKEHSRFVELSWGFSVQASALSGLHGTFSEAKFLGTGFSRLHMPFITLVQGCHGRESKYLFESWRGGVRSVRAEATKQVQLFIWSLSDVLSLLAMSCVVTAMGRYNSVPISPTVEDSGKALSRSRCVKE